MCLTMHHGWTFQTVSMCAERASWIQTSPLVITSQHKHETTTITKKKATSHTFSTAGRPKQWKRRPHTTTWLIKKLVGTLTWWGWRWRRGQAAGTWRLPPGDPKSGCGFYKWRCWRRNARSPPTECGTPESQGHPTETLKKVLLLPVMTRRRKPRQEPAATGGTASGGYSVGEEKVDLVNNP